MSAGVTSEPDAVSLPRRRSCQGSAGIDKVLDPRPGSDDARGMRLAIRTVPWVLAIGGLGIPLLAGGFAGWPYVVGWAVVFVVFALALRNSPTIHEVSRPAFLLPVLFVLGIVGGWYLIPADLAWLVIEVHEHHAGGHHVQATAGPVRPTSPS
jgi:hypothetical protein